MVSLVVHGKMRNEISSWNWEILEASPVCLFAHNLSNMQTVPPRYNMTTNGILVSTIEHITTITLFEVLFA